MAFPSVTYTFTNGTLADATQVNQNFSDMINAMSDGTKSLSISALTCAGTATFSGNLTLGASSANTLNFISSLASSIPIATTNSYDIGSDALGLRSVYLGSGSSAHSTRVIGASVASAWTLTLPLTGGTSRYRLETDGSGVSSWQPKRRSASSAENIGLSCSVNASALTITVTDAGGSGLSSSSPVDVVFRSSTSATGTAVSETATSAISMVVPSGATLGHGSGINNYIFVYLLDNAGTMEMAVSSYFFSEGSVQSSTAITSGSTSSNVLYSTSSRSNLGIRLIGRMLSNQVTAGTWALVPTEISLSPPIQSYSIPMFFSSGGGVLTSNSTQYLGTIESATESSAYFPVPFACIVSGMTAVISQTVASNTVFTVRKNSADTVVTTTVGVGSVVSAVSLNQAVFAAGDYLCVKAVATGTNSVNITINGSLILTRI